MLLTALVRAGCCPSVLADENGFYVGKLADAEVRAFATVARVLDAPKRQTRIRAHIFVYEADPGLQLFGRDTLPTSKVRRDDPRAQPEGRLVCDPDRVCLVGGFDNRRHRSKYFLVIGGH